MSHRPMLVFALEGSRPFAERVARRLTVPLAPLEERSFEDGEHKARPLQNVRGHDVFVLHALHGDDRESANDKLCRLLFFCGALKDAGASSVTAVVPYLCYARKDRRTKPNDPITTRYVAALFEAIGIDRVIAVEVHNVSAFENAFRCPTLHVECAPLLASHFAPLLRGQQVVAVSPDAGGAKREDAFRRELQCLMDCDVGSAFMEKSRSGGIVSGELLAGDVAGKVAVIVDDLISTGGTLVRAARACRTAGATKIYAAAAHGLFMEGAPALMAEPAIDGIVVTNTVPPFSLSPENTARLTIVDAGEAIAAAIASCRDGG
ncbi:ribose-phosphate pyrophosphokinase [Enhydrobacter aerosaccus]|uniref:ribose-phosphate diphosphokinase n=1 Tax=Enhydrobacter aerosaccus TaxID=225324 RepID=A0A1T4T5X8_9HYPH|nr:ribose-phosphate pyrophosphokinase [Enhydrobacter aerosaccus]SKA35895.1 ribose-phosphate pyrophosphokinase [Enhydrobacter aerosaccus]